jgi:TonB family protein
MLGENEQPQINLAGLDASSDQNRRRQMLALSLLLLAFILVVVRYRHFWFESLTFENAAEQTNSDKLKESQPIANSTTSRKNSKQHPPSVAGMPTAELPGAQEQAEVISAPLRVDVTYASGQHETLLARNSAIHLDFQHDPRQSVLASPADPGSGVINASERVSYSLRTMETVVRPVEPIYPLLAQQTNLQGSVVLQARIGKDGSVQSLQVLSGPDILTSAALEAVRQWRFKPHLEAGQAVPTETRITVNFTISTP